VLNHIYTVILHTVVVLKSYLHRYSSYCGSVSTSGREPVMPLKKSSGVIAGIPYLNIEE
jgi:hypothetical protein